MTRCAQSTAQSQKIAALKQIITTGRFETLEKLEDAVDAFLWGGEDEESNENRPLDCSPLTQSLSK